MKRSRQGLLASLLGVVFAVTATTLAGPALASTQATPQEPIVKLVAAANNITTQSSGGAVILDPGIYVVSLGSALQFDLQRTSYTKPVTIAQVIHQPGGGTSIRPWPGSVLDSFYGLRDFVHLAVADAHGKVVASSPEEFCPNSFSPQRAVPDSAQTSPFPQECAFDPFAKSLVMGIARGWGVDSFVSLFHLGLGAYKVTATVTPQYVRLLHITDADATTSVDVTVVNGNGSSGMRTPAQVRLKPLASSPSVPYLAHPPESVLPDLVALPAWQISTAHNSGRDLLEFAATVWVGGNGPLDVEGFRVSASPIMPAYQYFWKNGQIIGRIRAGTMGFDSRPGHNHWHFEQFAAYRLLRSDKKLAVRSQKQGFCITPTDPVDLLAPHAVWQPSTIGLDGACGQPTALWVREMMPTGWGDTYFQSVAGQAFDVTSLPNGTYYIQIIANPLHLLHELSTTGNSSLRKVIIGGAKGHRTVTVPAWNGIDPEG